MRREVLRVALITGTLGQGGAEKQAYYVARALKNANIDVRVFSLTHNEYYEPFFCDIDLDPIWVGRFHNNLIRTARIIKELTAFQPHFIHSTHTYTNLYAGITGKLLGIPSIGSIRDDLDYLFGIYGRRTKILLKLPTAIISNSEKSSNGLVENGHIESFNSYQLPNVIDIQEYDRNSNTIVSHMQHHIKVILVARLVQKKRIDCFLKAFVLARSQMPTLEGVIVGDGPERSSLEKLATDLSLSHDEISFLGSRDDVPALLRQSDIFALSSQYEGFPNVILEAMAAKLPIITTPAGDAGDIVQHGKTGYVVPFCDIKEMATKIVKLANSAPLRRQLGERGRTVVEERFSFESLTENLFRIYYNVANQHKRELIRLLP